MAGPLQIHAYERILLHDKCDDPSAYKAITLTVIVSVIGLMTGFQASGILNFWALLP